MIKLVKDKKQTLKQKQLSKFMSLLLRHESEQFGLKLDEDGYTELNLFLEVIREKNDWKDIVLEDIEQVVKTCEKQRFRIKNGAIKAQYGHSKGNIMFKESIPPKKLFHGTHQKVLPNILNEGILKMNRQYVHLSETEHFASISGKRKGELVLLKVNTETAIESGVKFFYAGNEVWLSTNIPTNCFSV